jgi:hypothetical protein
VSTTAAIITPARPAHRAAVLRYASALLPPSGRRDPAAVTAQAAPLLDWAQQASGRLDLEVRMEALSRAYCNASPGASPLAADGLLAAAREYYRFITGGAAG